MSEAICGMMLRPTSRPRISLRSSGLRSLRSGRLALDLSRIDRILSRDVLRLGRRRDRHPSDRAHAGEAVSATRRRISDSIGVIAGASPVWPPPPLIEIPRRHQGRPIWIDPVVFRAIAISWNNIIIPRSRRYHGRRDHDPRSFMNDLCLARAGFSAGRPEGTQHQGRSESACDSHHLHHASASKRESAKGLKAS